MRITSSLVPFALYLSFAASLVIPDVRNISRRGNDLSRVLADGKRQGQLAPVGGGDGSGFGGIPGEGDMPGSGGLPGGDQSGSGAGGSLSGDGSLSGGGSLSSSGI